MTAKIDGRLLFLGHTGIFSYLTTSACPPLSHYACFWSQLHVHPCTK